MQDFFVSATGEFFLCGASYVLASELRSTFTVTSLNQVICSFPW